MDVQEILFGNSRWEVPNRYSNLQLLSSTGFTEVCMANDVILNKKVAIKKLNRIFTSIDHTKRALREVKLLKHVKHSNLISLLDLFSNSHIPDGLNDIYMVTSLNGNNLSNVIKSEHFNQDKIVVYTYQILKGLKYLHSANVIHRDLKLSNITVSPNDEIRLIDFGLPRITLNDQQTNYVVTRWYRAPELLLHPNFYTKSIDIWSLGCVLAEMYLKKPIFQGNSVLELMNCIIDVTGLPLELTNSPLFAEKKNSVKKNYSSYFGINSLDACDLLEHLLEIDPNKRFNCEQALAHKYLSEHRNEREELVAEPFILDLDEYEGLSSEEWKSLLFDEVKSFRQ